MKEYLLQNVDENGIVRSEKLFKDSSPSGEMIGTRNFTIPLAEDEISYNAPHTYVILNKEDFENEKHPVEYIDNPKNEIRRIDSITSNAVMGMVKFQKGPFKEVGLNGIFHEDLLAIVINRLEHFQASEFSCEENAKAIEYLKLAIEALSSRTKRKDNAGVLGTNNVDVSSEGNVVKALEKVNSKYYLFYNPDTKKIYSFLTYFKDNDGNNAYLVIEAVGNSNDKIIILNKDYEIGFFNKYDLVETNFPVSGDYIIFREEDILSTKAEIKFDINEIPMEKVEKEKSKGYNYLYNKSSGKIYAYISDDYDDNIILKLIGNDSERITIKDKDYETQYFNSYELSNTNYPIQGTYWVFTDEDIVSEKNVEIKEEVKSDWKGFNGDQKLEKKTLELDKDTKVDKVPFIPIVSYNLTSTTEMVSEKSDSTAEEPSVKVAQISDYFTLKDKIYKELVPYKEEDKTIKLVQVAGPGFEPETLEVKVRAFDIEYLGHGDTDNERPFIGYYTKLTESDIIYNESEE